MSLIDALGLRRAISKQLGAGFPRPHRQCFVLALAEQDCGDKLE
jgi:hypothetical protein